MGDSWLNLVKQDGATVLITKYTGTSFQDKGANSHVITLQGDTINGGSLANTVRTDSFLMDGSGDYATIPDHADFDVTASWSVEWVMKHTIHPAENQSMVINAGPSSLNNNIRILVKNAGLSTAAVAFFLRETAVNSVNLETSASTVSHDIVEHWCIVYSSVSATVYKNGSSISTSAGTLLGSAASTVNIGRNEVTAGQHFSGQLGNLAIYKSVALTASQVLHHASSALNYDNRGEFTGSGRFSNRGLASGFI